MRIDGKKVPQNNLSSSLKILWFLPPMDRIWMETSKDRRKFLDRMVFSLDINHAKRCTQYEKLLRDAINGNQSSFVHADEVMESWRIVDDLLCTGDSCPIRTAPFIYHPGTWGPVHKTERITNWDYPA